VKTKTIIAFAYFLIAAVFGLAMRLSFISDLGVTYKHILHTHSHIALLGWLYNLALIFIGYTFLKEDVKKFNRIFWVSQITFLGMLFSFPFQGYAFWSISFSTLYLFASYWLIFEIFKSSKKLKGVEGKLLRAGGLFLFLSSIGPFALGAIMANQMKDTIWYHLSIFWFLHFLFNGFFYTVFLVLLLREIKKVVSVSEKKIKWVYYLTAFSIIPLYAEFVLESVSSVWLIVFALLSSLAQLASVLLIIKEIKIYFLQIVGNLKKALFGLSILSLLFKVVFQLLASLPFLNEMVFNSKSTLIIGYLHMVMLGMFSLFFIWVLIEQKVIKTNKLFKMGIWIFIVGVLLSELTLFGQGVANYVWHYGLPNYYMALFSVSALMPLGVLGMLVSMFIKKLK